MLHKFSHELTCKIFTNHSIKIGREARAWPTCDYGEKSETHLSSLLAFLSNWLNFRVRGQFEIKMLIVLGHSDINTTYFIWILKNKLEPAIIWKLVTCMRITSKNTRHLSPRYGQVILVSGYLVLTAVNWSQHWCAISGFPKKRECVRVNIGMHVVRTDGLSGGRAVSRCTVTWLPNFLEWVDYFIFLPMVLR